MKEETTMKNLQSPTKPMFSFSTEIGGNTANGNGYKYRYWTLYFFRKMYSGVLWRWKVGNGDDGTRTLVHPLDGHN